MTKAQAVKKIFNILNDWGFGGGLPRAVDIYKYLSCGGELVITEDIINRYFNI